MIGICKCGGICLGFRGTQPCTETNTACDGHCTRICTHAANNVLRAALTGVYPDIFFVQERDICKQSAHKVDTVTVFLNPTTQYGMEINAGKTEVMRILSRRTDYERQNATGECGMF